MRYETEKIDNLPSDTMGEMTPKNAIKLNANENPYPACKEVMDELKNIQDDEIRLYPDITNLKLKTEIANYLSKNYNERLEPSNIFIANGSDQVLAMIFQTFFENCKKPILMPEITYCYDIWAEISSSNYKFVPCKDDFQIDVEALKNSHAGGVILANPNVTGLKLSFEEVKSLVDYYSGKALVIVDEAYIEFLDNTSVLSLIQKYDNLIITRTFSKAFGLAFARIGYAISSKANIAALEKLKDAYSIVLINGFSVKLAEAVLKNYDYYKRNIEKIKATRNSFLEFLKNNGNFEYIPSNASFVIFKHRTITANELYLICKANDIYIKTYNSEKFKNYVRVSIGTDEQMEKLKGILKQI